MGRGRPPPEPEAIRLQIALGFELHLLLGPRPAGFGFADLHHHVSQFLTISLSPTSRWFSGEPCLMQEVLESQALVFLKLSWGPGVQQGDSPLPRGSGEGGPASLCSAGCCPPSSVCPRLRERSPLCLFSFNSS